MSNYHKNWFEIWAGYGLVLGWLAVLKIPQPELFLAKFEGIFSMVHNMKVKVKYKRFKKIAWI